MANQKYGDFDAIIRGDPNAPPVCDFCASKKPIWRYPCKSFMGDRKPRYVGGTITLQSNNDWAACEECGDLIEEGNLAELEVRSMKGTFSPEERAKLNEQQYKMMHDMVRDSHVRFFDNRSGPRRRFEGK